MAVGWDSGMSTDKFVRLTLLGLSIAVSFSVLLSLLRHCSRTIPSAIMIAAAQTNTRSNFKNGPSPGLAYRGPSGSLVPYRAEPYRAAAIRGWQSLVTVSK
eukprot:515143-Hanusia_phi.AAC.1